MGRHALVSAVAILALALAAPASARKIDVGGHRLYYEVRGRGPALVVFDAGLGDTHETWRWVWPDVARFARVLLYDRGGLGRSDPGPPPRTSESLADELRALLSAAGLEGPYILVGHSFGGLNARLFASRHSDEVAWLVLVEPTPLDYPAREAELLTEFARAKLATTIGASPPGVRLERAAIETSVAQLREAAIPHRVGVTLITSTRPEETRTFQDAWIQMQRALALELDVHLHLVTGRAGHYVQFDAPHLVVGAIREAVRSR